eukprot:GHVN01071117.1.p1 GENE.GHVN01071117.1~~GHVN01071117.1.p1  ORF type:complete len:134 (+),score=19.68 GHVN01071117.1:222-623(+)
MGAHLMHSLAFVDKKDLRNGQGGGSKSDLHCQPVPVNNPLSVLVRVNSLIVCDVHSSSSSSHTIVMSVTSSFFDQRTTVFHLHCRTPSFVHDDVNFGCMSTFTFVYWCEVSRTNTMASKVPSQIARRKCSSWQ